MRYPILAAKPSAFLGVSQGPQALWLSVSIGQTDHYEMWLTKKVKKEKGKY